jgi:hypothetical protein
VSVVGRGRRRSDEGRTSSPSKTRSDSMLLPTNSCSDYKKSERDERKSNALKKVQKLIVSSQDDIIRICGENSFITKWLCNEMRATLRDEILLILQISKNQFLHCIILKDLAPETQAISYATAFCP